MASILMRSDFTSGSDHKIDPKEKALTIQNVFNQYDFDRTGELTPIQAQMLHGDMRMGGISYPQVLASIKYVCATETCHISEVEELLQEMDRRYFLVQDLRWEFSFLDREQKHSISVEQARWLVQTVHGKYFSRGKWTNFVKSRAIPSGPVSFAEIEVMLCEVPSRTSLEEEERERERLLREKQKRRDAEMEAARLERDRKRQEREEARRKLEDDRQAVEQDRRRREDEEDERRQEEAERKRREEEEELERLRRLEEEERRKREEEELMYRDAELHRDEAERAEKEADDELSKLRKQKDGADQRRRKQLEEEEEMARKKKKENQTKRIRYQLKVAIKSRDKYQLEYSIGEFKQAKLTDDDMDLNRATRLLKQLSAKDGLNKAMSKREIQDLEQAMAFVRKHGFEVELAKEMMSANMLLSRLRRLERIRHEILELKQATVAEIRSYQNPPVIVHTVMTGTFLLLGHKEKETKDWKAVQSLVGKTGKESLKRRCLELDATKLPLGPAKRAKKLLDKFELDEVRDISAGAATFFVWATAMIEEALENEAHEAEKIRAQKEEEEEKKNAESVTESQGVESGTAVSESNTDQPVNGDGNEGHEVTAESVNVTGEDKTNVQNESDKQTTVGETDAT